MPSRTDSVCGGHTRVIPLPELLLKEVGLILKRLDQRIDVVVIDTCQRRANELNAAVAPADVLPFAITPTAVVPFGPSLASFIAKKAGASDLAKLTCPNCHLTFAEFQSTGLLGCPADYDAFEKALVPLIERAHEGGSHHVGKIPRRLGTPRPVENDLVRLRGELTKAVSTEQYEKAATLRDQIKTLETG